MPHMHVHRSGGIVFTPTKQELEMREIRKLKEELKREVEEARKYREELERLREEIANAKR